MESIIYMRLRIWQGLNCIFFFYIYQPCKKWTKLKYTKECTSKSSLLADYQLFGLALFTFGCRVDFAQRRQMFQASRQISKQESLPSKAHEVDLSRIMKTAHKLYSDHFFSGGHHLKKIKENFPSSAYCRRIEHITYNRHGEILHKHPVACPSLPRTCIFQSPRS